MAEELEIEEQAYVPRQKLPFRCCGRLGNCFCAFITSGGEPWVCIGPDWPFCICLLSLIVAACLCYLLVMAPAVSAPMQLLGALILTSVLGCYLTTALKNPGIELVRGLELASFSSPSKAAMRPCPHCGAVRQEDTYHCEDCNLCIRQYDHHCPLTGKCIGEGNILFFYGFVASVFCFILYLVLWAVCTARVRKED